MKHDFRRQPEGPEAEQFLAWLEHETVDMLRSTQGDPEGTKTSIFLYVNRAHEAHLSDEHIGALFGTCFVRAGRPEEEQDRAFDFLEFFGQIAQATHNRT